MKILLVDPPYGDEDIGGKKRAFKNVLNKIPSLGLAYLAAVAEKKGHQVKICDCTLENDPGIFYTLLEDFSPHLLGVTCTTPLFENAFKLSAYAKNNSPSLVTVCGGPHPTAQPLEVINSGVFDFAAVGEGEDTFSDLIDYLSERKTLYPDGIKGIIFKKEDKVIINPSREPISNLDEIPLPARHLLPPLSEYRPTPASYRKLPLGVIMTSRGCPGNCTFCDRAVFGQHYRKRSIENVMQEVEEVVSLYGAREIRFFDDTFTLDSLRLEGLCREIKKMKPAVPWTCLTRVNTVDYPMLKMMKDSGCWQVLFGLESGDDYILEKLGKNTTVEENRRAVLWAKKAGLSIRADFLVGSPWETKETILKTVEFARSLPLDFAHFNKFVPYPGTQIYKELQSRGQIFSFGRGAYINNTSDFIYIPPGLDKDYYMYQLNKAYKDFYLRPEYILKKLLSIRTFTEFKGHFYGFFSISSL